MDFEVWVHAVREADAGEFWFGTIFLMVIGLVAFYGIFRFIHRVRMMEDTPTARVRSAAQGYVELEGFGELMKGTPIIAPLTGTKCTWYSYKIEEKTGSYYSRGGRRTRWRTLRSGISDNLFLLVDDTGECVIDPDGAEVIAAANDVWYGNSPDGSYGLPGSRSGIHRFISSGHYRFTEKRLHPAEPLYAIGLFRTVGGSQELPNTHEEVRQLLTEWKRDQRVTKRFDQDGDGQLDMDEWDKVRKAAQREVLTAQRERAHGPVTHILSKPEDSRRPYLLSVKPQDILARHFRYYAAGSMLVFLGCDGLATWLLTVRFMTVT